MVRPLRKRTGAGTLYVRRAAVETEITELEQLGPDELVARCRLWPKSAIGFVSPEALLYFVRTVDTATQHHESLLSILIGRATRLLPKPDCLDGSAVDIDRLAIRDRVMDAFVDLLLADQIQYEERLDYFEINFNGAMAKDRLDASRQVWTEANRLEALENEDEEITSEVENAIEHYNPYDPDELDKKDYRQLLDGAIDALPPLQSQIVEMLRQEIPITSGDPDTPTISKILGKAEKTIRNQRDRAFATLRRRLERKEGLK
ncbi:sigma-70 family RNA polymerase sigma factor [Paraburkholderia acidiphila]|uniref:Sigma-70 family RNA polymerase sigma factor n=1 Tax=Paraburkholderia acidiphila TaxID=2571747 RepID=A0A7Z2G1C1_9BURK|nr:sigma-70 family RNA polymerase sigma factor [Paraburkholderia acidiphila]